MTPLPDPQFPPLFQGHGLDRDLDPDDVALSRVATGAAAAGDLFWSRRRDRLQYALVLEPEVGATEALGMVVVAMVAVGDAIGVLAPPEVAVTYRWPGTICANGAEIGSVRAAIPAGAGDTVPPDWLVLGLTLAIEAAPDGPEPGHRPERTSLQEEGCAGLDRTALVEAICRHLLTEIDAWSRDGLERSVRRWLERCPDHGQPVAFAIGDRMHRGIFTGLDANGSLVLEEGGGAARTVTMAEAMAALQDDKGRHVHA